jgi:hypothetical protein
MSRTPAAFTQADVNRAVKGARKAGASAIELRTPRGGLMIIHLNEAVDVKKPLADQERPPF